MTPNAKTLFDRANKLDSFSDIEMSNQETGNVNEIRVIIAELLAGNHIAEIGKTFDKTYRKIFPVYTTKTISAERMADKMKQKQFQQQKKSLTESLLKKLKESGNMLGVQAEYEMMQSASQKVNLKFFQLSHTDILNCYKWVIANGQKELDQREKKRKQKEAMEIAKARQTKKAA